MKSAQMLASRAVWKLKEIVLYAFHEMDGKIIELNFFSSDVCAFYFIDDLRNY